MEKIICTVCSGETCEECETENINKLLREQENEN